MNVCFSYVGPTLTKTKPNESIHTVWITDGEGQVLPAMFSYRFAWFSFHPDSETFSAPE